MRTAIKNTALALALVAAGAGGWTLRGGRLASAARADDLSTPAAPAAAPASPAAPAVPGVRAGPDFSAIVRQYGPAVVNIAVSGTVKAGGPMAQLDPSDPMAPFFRRFMPPQGEQPVRGLGSGFIVKKDGVILTNAHVVDGAKEVRVKLTDGREFPAKVVGVDKPTDVAVLRIEARGDLPVVRLGDASKVQVGEWVLAIGSPFGFESTATAGIVSAKARSLPNEGYVPFLQTDVAVNPGNSGGPLFNVAGEVVGINSQIYSSSGGYQGLSFAVPIDVAMRVEGQLLAHGKVTRGRLGIVIQDVDQALADSFGLPRPAGALVSRVEKDGPGGKAGLQPGDVILSVDGREVGRSGELPPLVGELSPGTRARLQVWRQGARKEVPVTVGAAPGDEEAAARADQPEQGKLGLAVRPLSPQEQQQAGVEGGLLVERAAGPAARAGVQPGDVVLALNGAPVRSAEQLKSLLGKSKSVALLVQRGEARLFLPVEIG